MIYVVGDLQTAVKVAYGPKAFTVNRIDELTSKLQLDPEISGVDIVVAPLNYCRGIQGDKLRQAIKQKHSKVVVSFFYRNLGDLDAIEDILNAQLPNVFQHQINKISESEYIQQCIEEDIEKAVLAGNIDMPQVNNEPISPIGESVDVFEGVSSDAANPFAAKAATPPPLDNFTAPSSGVSSAFSEPPPVPIHEPPVAAAPSQEDIYRRPTGQQKRVRRVEFIPGGAVDIATAEVKTVDNWEIPEEGVSTAFGIGGTAVDFSSFARPTEDLRTRFRNAAGRLDTGAVQTMITSNEITRQLMSENSHYVSAQQAVDLITKEISAIFADTRILPKERLDRIRNLCSQKSTHQAVINQEYVKEFLGVIETIVSAAVDTATDIKRDYKMKFATPEVSDIFYSDKGKIEELATSRLNAQMTLVDITTKLREMYLSVDEAANGVIEDLDKEKLSANPLVNEALKPIQEMFTPVNRTELIRSILNSLSDQRRSFSQVENDLTELMESLFKLYDLTNDFSASQERMVKILTANRVEELVVCDNLLKYKLHTIVGADNVGKTATAVAIATAKSRADNVLLIDLSANSKLDRYVRANYTLTEFYDIQTKDSLTIVKRTQDCVYNNYKLQEALNAAIAHYKYIYVLISTKDTEEYEDLKKMSCTVNFVTNVTIDKLEEIQQFTKSFDEDNTSMLVTLINCDGGELDVLEMLGVDPLMSGLRKVPFFQEVQRATLRKRNPCDSDIVRDYFIENFA